MVFIAALFDFATAIFLSSSVNGLSYRIFYNNGFAKSNQTDGFNAILEAVGNSDLKKYIPIVYV